LSLLGYFKDHGFLTPPYEVRSQAKVDFHVVQVSRLHFTNGHSIRVIGALFQANSLVLDSGMQNNYRGPVSDGQPSGTSCPPARREATLDGQNVAIDQNKISFALEVVSLTIIERFKVGTVQGPAPVA
jgi:hypothetical protein